MDETNYMAVEGEIRVGDWFLLKEPHLHGQLRMCYWILKNQPAWSEERQDWSDIQDCLYIDPKESKGCGFAYRNEAVKVIHI